MKVSELSFSSSTLEHWVSIFDFNLNCPQGELDVLQQAQHQQHFEYFSQPLLLKCSKVLKLKTTDWQLLSFQTVNWNISHRRETDRDRQTCVDWQTWSSGLHEWLMRQQSRADWVTRSVLQRWASTISDDCSSVELNAPVRLQQWKKVTSYSKQTSHIRSLWGHTDVH